MNINFFKLINKIILNHEQLYKQNNNLFIGFYKYEEDLIHH